MQNKIFITGTDTDIGKTYIATKLLEHLKGYKTIGLKPIAAGCDSDAKSLQNAATIKLPYEKVNPFALEKAVAPHIAAKEQGLRLDVATVAKEIVNIPADFYIVEGAGGWLVPLNSKETLEDFVKDLSLSVILVVGVKLGCLNHALLTHRAILQSKVPYLGWIANCLDPDMEFVNENIEYLKSNLSGKCLGVAGFGGDASFDGFDSLFF